MPKKIVDPPARVLMWRRLDQPGLERVAVSRTPSGYRRFSGVVLAAEAGTPYLVRYVLLCDEDWSSQYLALDVRHGPGASRYVQLVTSGTGQWQHRESMTRQSVVTEPFRDLALPPGCVDIDLGFSPLTNTLPLRRLRARAGASIETTAAWIRFPELDIQPLAQQYHFRAPGQFVYESESGYRADIVVDEFGYVIRYDDLWERIAEAHSA